MLKGYHILSSCGLRKKGDEIMQFFYKMFLGFIVILFIVFGSLFVLHGMNNKWVDEDFPILTEEVITQLEQGHYTWLFDREDVVRTYLSEKFPQKEVKILREKDLNQQFLYAVDIEGMNLKLRLQKRNMENIPTPIWVVKQIQQDI